MQKRLIDILFSAIILSAGLPFLVLIACFIKLTDGGPILFRQIRIGKGGRKFQMLKFRSMVVDAEDRKETLAEKHRDPENVTFKMKDDPRVTWIGRFLRKTSIDEMPQLWNVLRGEMSLVGPRPPLPGEVSKYGLLERKRLEVKPGLTCLWQIKGRSDLSFSHQVVLDIAYIRNRSLQLDFEILMRTIPVVLTGRGAY
jgi:lipopolysaccharide/colanic/teichoic acid biosynthesis glycosyltransferase